MRALLAIVVTVAQVAGPWLCCCGPIRVLAAAPVAATAGAPAEAACPHCRQKQSGHAICETPAAPQSPAEPPALPGRCPCCAVKLVDAVAAEPSRDADQFFAAVGLLPPVLCVLDPAADVPSAAGPLPGVRDLPILTTEARLYAHHALRC